ncbi:MAG: NB-ARC domain-containing protein, partial [Bacteroidales bacterium]
TRLLAAIMFTDMVGYTALMQEDERQAKQNRDRHRKILQKSIAKHKGKILQYYGDGTLSIFNSAIEAVECAIQIQQELQTEPKIPLRIGLHTGDIAYDDEGVYGDGVNIASRIQELAISGSILISGKVFDDIKNHHAFKTVSLGAFDLKNVKKPVEVYAIGNEGLAVPAQTEIQAIPKDKVKSLAVLPFVNMSPDTEQEYFSDGITEEITADLSHVQDIRVISRTSAMQLKGTDKNMKTIARELNVQYVLEGSVRKAGKALRITVQLIDAINDKHLWSEKYSGTIDNVFDIQEKVSSSIVDVLKLKLHPEEDKKIAERPIANAKDEKIVQHNLPVQLTSFTGREKEMQVIRQLIREHRIVSLTGAGGCGKTRLACEVVAQLVQDYKDGVWFVDLAPITSEDLVVKEITEVLKIVEVPNQPIIDTLIEKIKNKNLLIILDNCEHLIKACAEIAGKMLQSVPGLKILVTSREALNIKGEQVWRVPSLTLIDPKTIVDLEHAKDSEAVMLFTDRARLSNPEFELESENVNEVVTICNKLDGIPLALELVASRTRHMNTQMILERFADRFDQLSSSDPGTSKRQKTLQATIEWSYNLLSDSEKILFNRLAVFLGGFDIGATEEVCSNDQLPKETILDVLSRLVDQSLVYTIKSIDQSMRYNRLETLRHFAQQKLQSQKEEEAIRNRHLQYYLKMAEQAYEEQFESQLKWLNKLRVEHENLIAALNWSYNHSPEEFLRLSGTLAWFWRLHSHIQLGEGYLEKALSIADSKNEAYARALFGLAMIFGYTKDTTRVLDLMNESLTIWRQFKNLREEAWVLSEISEHIHRNGDYETSLKFSEQSLEIARKVGNPGLINHCLMYLYQRFVLLKQFDRGRPFVEELLISSEKLEHIHGIESARHALGDCALGMKNYKEAEKRYALAIETALKYGMIFLATVSLQGVAFALSGQSRWAKSIQLDAAAREKHRALGVTVLGLYKFWDEWIDTYIEGAKEKLGEELIRKYEEEGLAMGFDKAVEYALDFKKD